jgi:hypothetical protein
MDGAPSFFADWCEERQKHILHFAYPMDKVHGAPRPTFGMTVVNDGFELSHPCRDETASWMGHPVFCGLMRGRAKEILHWPTPWAVSMGPIDARFRMTREWMAREFALVQEHGAVEGVALDGLEAGVADDAAEFFLGSAVRGAGRFDHVLFEHDGAYIVAAEVKT